MLRELRCLQRRSLRLKHLNASVQTLRCAQGDRLAEFPFIRSAPCAVGLLSMTFGNFKKTLLGTGSKHWPLRRRLNQEAMQPMLRPYAYVGRRPANKRAHPSASSGQAAVRPYDGSLWSVDCRL